MKYFLSLAIIFSLAIKPISQKSFSLDTLLVQTTRIPLKASETGRSISILTKEQIQQLPATTFYELLQTICGVEVQSRGGFGVQGDIVMRGSTFSQVLVLIDGMKINDPLTRMRPIDIIANPKDSHKSIFISSFDTNPLSPRYKRYFLIFFFL